MNAARAILLLLLFAPAPSALAARVTVAVAANFAATAERIADAFTSAQGHEIVLIAGSTGKHYAQVVAGAPFDVLLAADRVRPERLEQGGLAVAGSRFTYAHGRLALWSPQDVLIDEDGRVLQSGAFHHLALANPRHAPYGLAAQQVLTRLGLWESLQPRLVFGESVGQAFGFVRSGAAELGFVALSQVIATGSEAGSAWTVPESLHAPIEQQAVLLRDAPAPRAFLAFLRGETAGAIIAASGYGAPGVH